MNTSTTTTTNWSCSISKIRSVNSILFPGLLTKHKNGNTWDSTCCQKTEPIWLAQTFSVVTHLTWPTPISTTTFLKKNIFFTYITEDYLSKGTQIVYDSGYHIYNNHWNIIKFLQFPKLLQQPKRPLFHSASPLPMINLTNVGTKIFNSTKSVCLMIMRTNNP